MIGSDKHSDWLQPSKSHYLKAPLICAVIILLVYPFESVVVPAWRLRVVDLEGNPCPDKQVNQGWKHYSLELGAGDYGEYKFTDGEGYIVFPERTVRASLIRRIFAPVIAHILTIAHGSTGISGYVFASGIKGAPWLSYKPGEPLPDTIIVERCRMDGG